MWIINKTQHTTMADVFKKVNQYIEDKLANNESLHYEFRGLERERIREEDISESVEDQNRYPNVIPNRDTRVDLKDVEGNPVYVNANQIYENIVTQAPVPASMTNFWKMIHDFDVHTIVALVNTTEFNQPTKAHPYWQNDGDTCVFDTTVGKDDEEPERITVRVKLVSTDSDDVFINVRIFHLINRNTGDIIRKVTQHHYKVWPDLGVPNVGGPIDALAKLLITVCKDTYETKHMPLIHCSAGVGRSGVFVAALTVIQTYYSGLMRAVATKTGTPFVGSREDWGGKIPAIVNFMRFSRPVMVQSFPQYRLVYQLVSICMDELREEKFPQ